MNMDDRLNLCTFLHIIAQSANNSLRLPQGHRTDLVRFIEGRDDCMITLRLSYDVRKASVKFCPSLSQGDRKQCKHIRRSLKPPTMPKIS